MSGREGLGTPPAPPAEEALTAEHGGAHPSPSSSAHHHISTDLPPPLTPSPSLAFSLALYLFPVVPNILAQFLPHTRMFPYVIFPFHFVHRSFCPHCLFSLSVCFTAHFYLFLFFQSYSFMRQSTQGNTAGWLEVLNRLLFPCLFAR